MFKRSIRPPDDIVPNPNDPAAVPPSTVGPDQLVQPGDPHGVTVDPTTTFAGAPPRIIPSAWSGWPADWWPPMWGSSGLQSLTDCAWMCVDLNASLFATMPPYLVGARTNINAGWLDNPDPDLYASWEEFAKQLWWDYQAVGEAFVLVTSRYATGWPARFHVVPPWFVNVEMEEGRRYYSIGAADVTADILHIRYSGTTIDMHGHGPLEAGNLRMVAAQMLAQYGTQFVTSGAVPTGVLTHPEKLEADQAAALQAQWVAARQANLGLPGVVSGGLTFEPIQMNAEEMALIDLVNYNERRICVLLGVPPQIVAVPTTGDSMTYRNIAMLFDFHWRAGLRPKAQTIMAALSQWALPRGVRVEVNGDAYVQPEPLERAQTYQTLASIVDPITGQQALTVDEIRTAERLDTTTAPDATTATGVLK